MSWVGFGAGRGAAGDAAPAEQTTIIREWVSLGEGPLASNCVLGNGAPAAEIANPGAHFVVTIQQPVAGFVHRAAARPAQPTRADVRVRTISALTRAMRPLGPILHVRN